MEHPIIYRAGAKTSIAVAFAEMLPAFVKAAIRRQYRA
jgi:hypothetical protein